MCKARITRSILILLYLKNNTNLKAIYSDTLYKASNLVFGYFSVNLLNNVRLIPSLRNENRAGKVCWEQISLPSLRITSDGSSLYFSLFCFLRFASVVSSTIRKCICTETLPPQRKEIELEFKWIAREKERERYCRADYGYYRCLLSPVTYTVDDLDGGMKVRERERGWIILRFVPHVFWVRTETKRNVEKS